MFNKKYLIVFLALLISCMSVAVASDINDSAAETTYINDDAPISISEVQEQTSVSEKNIITKETNNLKQNPTTISVNNDNFDTYFKSTGFGSNVNDGDSFLFTGNVSRYNNTTYLVNKQVNIDGDNHTITLNTTSGSYFGNETGSSFIFDNGANYSSVTNLNFYNTQVIVRNTSHIVFNNINQTVSNQRIGQGIGTFSIRDASSYITVENSAFSTTNNDNSSTLVLADAQHCTIDNNTITGMGEVGNLLYLTTYNIETTPTENTNSYNIIRYNTINGPSTSSPFCWALVLSGHDNTVFKNTINYMGTAITTQAINVIDENNYQQQISLDNVIANNTVNNAGSVKIITENTVVNNTFTGILQTGTNSLIENNTITKKVTAQSGSSLYYNTIFDGVKIAEENVILIGNNISKTVNITINNVYLEYNHICGIVKLTSSFTNVTMKNNIHCGGFYGNKYPSINTNNTPCSSGCAAITCGCQQPQLNTNKNIKEDDGDIIDITRENVQEYFEIYNEDGDIADLSREVGFESTLDYMAAKNNRGKTYRLDQSAVNALGRNLISFNTNFYNISIVGKNNPTISVYDFSTGTNVPLFANFTIRLVNDEYNSPGSASFLVPSSRDFETNGIVENITINGQWRNKLEYTQEMVSFLEGNPYSQQKELGSGIVRNCTFNLAFVSDTIDWENVGRPLAVPIFLPGYANEGHIKIENSNINITELNYDGHYATIWGIYNTNNGTEILNNTIYIHGEKYLYSIENVASNTIIKDNNIIVNGIHYTAGVYITGTNMQNNTVETNNITLYSGYHNPKENGPEEDSGYGVVIEDRAYFGSKYDETTGSNVYNNRIINNNITTYGHNIYSVEHYGGKNTTIAGNNISAYGINPTGIALTGINITIENNTIIAQAQTNVTGQTVDYFPAISAGIYLQLSLKTDIINNNITVENATGIYLNQYNNVNVTQNNVTTTDDYAVLLNKVKDSSVTENNLIARTLKGDAAVLDNEGTNNIIQLNQPAESVKEYTLKIDTTEFTQGTNATITATIYSGDDIATDINKGKIVFKVNGKTLKDNNGKVIYAKVTNGIASIENYPIPESWNNQTIIEAIYSGSADVKKMSSDKQNIIVTPKEITTTTKDVTATAGSTTTLSATLNDNTINTGKVVFKINGKTVKDANGKAIYAKVVNGQVSIEYTIPENMKTGTYHLTAVYITSDYKRIEDTKILTVN